ncbi:hypothetical protein ACF8K2_12260 [Pseudomonas sp. xss_2]
MNIQTNRRILRITNHGEIPLPFGLTKAYKEIIKQPNATLHVSEKKVIYIEAQGMKIQLYPPYSKKIKTPHTSHSLTFTIVTSERDRRACLAILLNEHYLPPPNRGIYFAVKDKENIVGCCILDTLNFGNPKGRYYIDPALSDQLNLHLTHWSSMPSDVRHLFKTQLGLIWVSRIARDRNYKHMGLGALLIQETIAAIPCLLPNAPKHIEIIRTQALGAKPQRDFLIDSGFQQAPRTSWGGAYHSPPSQDEWFPSRIRSEKVYYWKRLPTKATFEVDRLFVPLSEAPFLWFRDKNKTWELRRHRGQFTTRHVFPGKCVELRKGYNTSCTLWGTINKVIHSTSIEQAFEMIGDYKKILPTAVSFEDAMRQAQAILNPPPDSAFIAFEITNLIDPDLN